MKYYVLFSCDKWKSTTSMDLRMVTNSKLTLLNTIKEEILSGNMCYDRLHDMYEVSQEQMADDWEIDQCKLPLDTELNHLVYGYVTEVEDGELQ